MKSIYVFIKRLIPNRVKQEIKNVFARCKVLYKRIVLRPYTSSKHILFFDISTYAMVEKHTGIQRVVEKFMDYLPEVIGEEYELVCLSGLEGYHIIDAKTFAVDKKQYPKPKKGDIFLSIDLNHEVQNGQREVLEAWQENGCKLVFCMFDLVFALHSQYIDSKEMVDHLNQWAEMICKMADGIICISDSVRGELDDWMKHHGWVNEHLHLGYYHLGADFAPRAMSNTEAVMAEIPERIAAHKGTTYIMVSTIEPRKGYPDAVEAFELARKQREDITLVIVGRHGWKCENIEERIKGSVYYNESLFWMDDCDDDTLTALYDLSDAYITCSYYEGFGLGIIEAAHVGLPVIVRDIPINREVTAGHALFFQNPEELSQKMLDVTEEKPSGNLAPELIPCLSWKESVTVAWEECLQTLK